jgi:hypothetical protein
VRKIVLIGGMPRSGTNLARRIIGSHSKIAIPAGEFKFFSKYLAGKSVTEILTYDRLKSWNIDFSDLYSCDYREAFITSLTRYTESVGKEILGEKTPYNEFYYDIVQDWLKGFDLKFVHLVRNPFDVIASYKYAPFRQNHSANVAANSKMWLRSVMIGLAREHLNPDGYYLLKYEDITTDPVGQTRILCKFLSVDFEEERMLNLVDFKGHEDNTSFPQPAVEKNQDYSAIRSPESRKHHLSDSEIRVVSSICGEIAWALGYDDDEFKPSCPEPANLGIMKRLRRSARNLSGLVLQDVVAVTSRALLTTLLAA